MRVFKLTIDCNHDAFINPPEGYGEGDEVQRLLEAAGTLVQEGHQAGTLVDTNGNNVGSFIFEVR